MSLESNDVATDLINSLEVSPYKAERFGISEGFEVDLLEFKDRPYKGVNSIITNGASNNCESKTFEFILIFDPHTLSSETDIFAFVATYLQLHFLPNHNVIDSGDYFSSNGRLIKGLEFTGMYTAEPCYFPVDRLEKCKNVKFLWLIPIYSNELEFIISNGAEAFETYLEEHDPDLSLFNRSPFEFNN